MYGNQNAEFSPSTEQEITHSRSKRVVLSSVRVNRSYIVTSHKFNLGIRVQYSNYNACLFNSHEGQRLFERPKSRREDNIKIDLK
jgi:hypothetical protein